MSLLEEAICDSAVFALLSGAGWVVILSKEGGSTEGGTGTDLTDLFVCFSHSDFAQQIKKHYSSIFEMVFC